MKELEVISKVVKINNSDNILYDKLADMRNLSRFIPPDIKDWKADENFCSFSVQGKNLALKIVKKEPYKLIKIATDDISNESFTAWIQLKYINNVETAARIVVHVKANLIVRNLIKGKLQDGVNRIVEFLKFL